MLAWGPSLSPSPPPSHSNLLRAPEFLEGSGVSPNLPNPQLPICLHPCRRKIFLRVWQPKASFQHQYPRYSAFDSTNAIQGGTGEDPDTAFSLQETIVPWGKPHAGNYKAGGRFMGRGKRWCRGQTNVSHFRLGGPEMIPRGIGLQN